MHTALTPLTLRPQAGKSHLEFADLPQRLRVELAKPGPTVLAHGPGRLRRARQRLLAAHARRRLLGKLHQRALRRGGDGDAARVFARQQLARLLLAQDGLEDAAERLGQLVVQVVLGVDRDVVFEHVDGIFRFLVVSRSARALDDDVGHAVAHVGGGALVALSHAFREFGVGLFGVVVVFGLLRQSFRDDEVGHVNLVL